MNFKNNIKINYLYLYKYITYIGSISNFENNWKIPLSEVFLIYMGCKSYIFVA